MPVKVEIFIQASADSPGLILPGPETLKETENWLNSLSIGNTVIDTWRKSLDTEQTIKAHLTLWPSIQSSTLDLSGNFKVGTSRRFRPISGGTPQWQLPFSVRANLVLLLVAAATFLVAA